MLGTTTCCLLTFSAQWVSLSGLNFKENVRAFPHGGKTFRIIDVSILSACPTECAVVDCACAERYEMYEWDHGPSTLRVRAALKWTRFIYQCPLNFLLKIKKSWFTEHQYDYMWVNSSRRLLKSTGIWKVKTQVLEAYKDQNRSFIFFPFGHLSVRNLFANPVKYQFLKRKKTILWLLVIKSKKILIEERYN